MTQQTMTKEFLTSKGLLTHGKSMFVISGDFGTVTLNELLEEYSQQELAKEREKAKKLVEAAKSVMKSWNERMNNEIEEEKENKHGPYKYWSPAASMVASSEINKLRQSLTEYEKS